jgi:hypothetical protein
MDARALGAAWALCLFGPQPAAAAPARPICLADLPARMQRELRIPIGCEAIDCCPGCPAGAIAWRVRVDGEVVEAVQLKLPGAHPLRLGRGERILETGIRARASEPAPLAELRVALDADVLEEWRRTSRRSAPSAPLGALSLSVEQLLGPFVVDRHETALTVVGCGAGATTACDQITQAGKAGSDASVILLDGRRQPGESVCSDDELLRATGTAQLGSLLDEAGCPSDLSVLSAGNAMAFEMDLSSWTDVCGDTLAVELKPIRVAPATFFFATPDDLAQAEWGLPMATVAQADLALANKIYDANKTGISLAMTPRPLTQLERLELLSLLVKVVEALALGFDPLKFVCGLPASLESKGLYVKGRLNVYYLPVPGTGMICPDDRNVVFIAMNKKPETLAHEYGHSLSLLGDPGGHTNGLPGFDSSNVMWVRENDVRDHFSLGQAFRQNVDTGSMLNVNGVRQEDTRACPLDADTTGCPPLALDWVRP